MMKFYGRLIPIILCRATADRPLSRTNSSVLAETKILKLPFSAILLGLADLWTEANAKGTKINIPHMRVKNPVDLVNIAAEHSDDTRKLDMTAFFSNSLTDEVRQLELESDRKLPMRGGNIVGRVKPGRNKKGGSNNGSSYSEILGQTMKANIEQFKAMPAKIKKTVGTTTTSSYFTLGVGAILWAILKEGGAGEQANLDDFLSTFEEKLESDVVFGELRDDLGDNSIQEIDGLLDFLTTIEITIGDIFGGRLKNPNVDNYATLFEPLSGEQLIDKFIKPERLVYAQTRLELIDFLVLLDERIQDLTFLHDHPEMWQKPSGPDEPAAAISLKGLELVGNLPEGNIEITLPTLKAYIDTMQEEATAFRVLILNGLDSAYAKAITDRNTLNAKYAMSSADTWNNLFLCHALMMAFGGVGTVIVALT